MSAVLNLKCTCGSTMKVKAKHAGKRAKCKGCGTGFTVPSIKGPAQEECVEEKAPSGPLQAAVAASTLGQSERKATQPAAETAVKEPCDSCGKEIDKGAVVCIFCGYHRKLKRRLETKTSERKGLEERDNAMLIRVLTYLVAILSAVVAFFSMRGTDGPSFLMFFFGVYVLSALLTVLLRKFWCDSDLINHAAIVLVCGMGSLRLLDAIANSRFRVTFLLVGMIVALFSFVITKTDGESENDTFQSDWGGMATIPAVVAYAVAAALMGTVYFVEPIGNVVAQMGMFVIIVMVVVTFKIWSSINGYTSDSGSSWWGLSSCSGCSSCSSCGGGCGGGGCGGCGG